MHEEQRSPDRGAPGSVAWARQARIVSLVAWALAALAVGGAAALAQDASLSAWAERAPLNTAAWLVLCGGLGLALLGWVFWAVVHIRLDQMGYRFEPSFGCGDLLSFLGSIAILCAGAVLASMGGNSDSPALPALLALGVGVAGAIAGFLGILRFCVVLVVQGMHVQNAGRECRRVWQERVLEAVEREGRDTTEMRRAMTPQPWWLAWFALDLLGSATGMLLLFVNPAVLGVAHLLHLPAAAGVVLGLVLPALLLFVSFRALIIVAYRSSIFVAGAAVQRYALSSATLLTTVFLLWGGLADIGSVLWLFAAILLLALPFIVPKLQKHYGV